MINYIYILIEHHIVMHDQSCKPEIASFQVILPIVLPQVLFCPCLCQSPLPIFTPLLPSNLPSPTCICTNKVSIPFKLNLAPISEAV